MAVSTERTFRTHIVEAFQARAVAQTLLGFDSPKGNVKDYLLDHESLEARSKYLAAQINGVNTVRAIGVEALGNDDWWSLNNITKREYQLTIQLYYAFGENGEGAKLVIDHANGLRGVLRAMGPTLDGYVTRVITTSRVDIRQISGVDNSTGKIWLGTMVYVCERTAPDFNTGA